MSEVEEIDAIEYYAAWADTVDENFQALVGSLKVFGDLVDIVRALHDRLAAVERELATHKAKC